MRVGAVMLAAGFGTRLAPLTDSTPKPLLDVGDRPVATRILERLAELDSLGRVVVVVNDRTPDAWEAWMQSLELSPEVQIVSNGVRESRQRPGAVADLARGLDALGSVDVALVVAGDNLIDEPFGPHVAAAGAAATPIVLCRRLDEVPPGRFGEITTDATGRVVQFREKPDDPSSPLVATCTYVLPGSVASDIATYLEAGDADSPGRFIGWLSERRTVLARELSGRYFDIGNIETLAAARAAYAGR